MRNQLKEMSEWWDRVLCQQEEEHEVCHEQINNATKVMLHSQVLFGKINHTSLSMCLIQTALPVHLSNVKKECKRKLVL